MRMNKRRLLKLCGTYVVLQYESNTNDTRMKEEVQSLCCMRGDPIPHLSIGVFDSFLDSFQCGQGFLIMGMSKRESNHAA